ncbi:uncharacterized protein LOC119644668 isoform X2 [Glossina fuscipes]|uniref:Uncharacterized protein LOC119644668 isoform X2 n=1 Tax=Glossina fuscipes TaxID=7396 RepID=A0A9C5ZN97_9MUSC|nr:uncharacterized protein LOC119644668 isoform X2 [Glossina fuscipes]
MGSSATPSVLTKNYTCHVPHVPLKSAQHGLAGKRVRKVEEVRTRVGRCFVSNNNFMCKLCGQNLKDVSLFFRSQCISDLSQTVCLVSGS